MAEAIDKCCLSPNSSSSMTLQLAKPDKNNNTTANIDDAMILPTEQCDTINDRTDQQSNKTNDTDDARLSSSSPDEDRQINHTNNTGINNPSIPTIKNEIVEVPVTFEPTAPNNNNATNTSNNHVQPSDPYKDFSGVDTESFISTTLRNNPKDRALLLSLETVLQQFIQSEDQTTYQFQAMNSYERMIVHRVAAFFGLDHNVDKNGQAVVVTKTANTRIPDFSFQKCIPEDESNDATLSNSNTDNISSASRSADIPTRRILRRHDKTSNHDYSQRNGVIDDLNNNPSSSNAKHSLSTKPYSERVSNYAETRARIFNETSNSNADVGNPSTSNKSNKNNTKQHVNSARTSYRKQHQNNSYQTRSFTYQHSQVSTNANNHIQHYGAGKTIDPSSHLLNNSTNRNASIYQTHQIPTANLNIGQSAVYAPMVAQNPATATLRAPLPTSFYASNPQQPLEYDFKQSIGNTHIYNYVPMVAPAPSNFIHQQQSQTAPPPQPQGPATNQNPGLHPQALTTAPNNNPNGVPSQHAAGMTALPILVHPQPNGQIQYLFAAPALQQQAQQQQQQQQQQHSVAGANAYPITADGQYVQIYRPDALQINGPPTTMTTASVMDSNNTHHHPHTHHPYAQSAPFHHHHQHPHSISQQAPQPTQQQQPSQQQSQQVQSQQQQTQPGPMAPSQSNGLTQSTQFVRLYSTGTPTTVSHSYAQSPYATTGPSPTAYVQPGAIGPGSFMITQQAATGVAAYPPYDNGITYSSYGPAPTQTLNGPVKANMNNNNTTASVQYATNHLSTLSLQSSHDDYSARLANSTSTRFNHPNGSTQHQSRSFIGRPLVQSPNGTTVTPRMGAYSTVANHSYRPSRPYNSTNTDKSMSSNENDSKSLSSAHHHHQQNPITMTNTSETVSLAGPAQE